MGRKKLQNLELAFLDLETTGTNQSIHEIIEVAVVLESEPLTPWSTKIRPERIATADQRALDINGYDAAHWLHAPTLVEVLPQLVGILADRVLVAHNLFGFDLPFLRSAYERHGYPTGWLGWPGVDTQSLAFSTLVPRGLERLNLNAVCEFLDIAPEGEVHRAAEGARRCRQVHEHMTRMIQENDTPQHQ